MKQYFRGWQRNCGQTILVDEYIFPDLAVIEKGARISNSTLEMTRISDHEVLLTYGPKKLNVNANYLVGLRFEKIELLNLAAKAFEGSPIGTVLSGLCETYHTLASSRRRITRLKDQVERLKATTVRAARSGDKVPIEANASGPYASQPLPP